MSCPGLKPGADLAIATCEPPKDRTSFARATPVADGGL